MGEILRRSPMTVALAVLAVLLAAVLALEFAGMGSPRPAASTRRVVPADAKLLPPLAAVAPEQAYPETAGRPLFTPTRRPAPEVAAVAQPTFQRGQFALLGVIMAGDTKTVMLREKANGRLHRLGPGQEVNGIKISQIDRESVLLTQGTETETVPLMVQKPGVPGQPGQPPVPGMPPQPTGAPMTSAAGQGPFAPAGTQPGAPANRPFVPAPNQAGMPMQAPPNAPGAPMPMPAGSGGGPIPAPGVASPQVQQQGEAGLTPEEILARRRARRAQQNQ